MTAHALHGYTSSGKLARAARQGAERVPPPPIITQDRLEYAFEHNFTGFYRLAKFVGLTFGPYPLRDGAVRALLPKVKPSCPN